MYADKSNEQKFDVRLAERYRAKGIYTEKELQKWLASLPDASDNADRVTAGELFGRSIEDDESDE